MADFTDGEVIAEPTAEAASLTDPVAAPAATPVAEPVAVAPRRSRWRWPLLLSIPLLIAAVGAYFWLTGGTTVSTDNAYVQQNKVSIAPEVGGRIVSVAVAENQTVKAGDILFTIDPAPYRLAVTQADAAIAAAQVQVATLQSAVPGDQGAIEAARSSLTFAQENFDRNQALMRRGFNTNANMEKAQNQVAQARAVLVGAQADAAESRAKLSTGAAVPGVNPQVAAGKAQRAAAELNLSRTVVRAPVDGVVTQADRLQIGQQAVAGLPTLTVVAGTGTWIEANFKETDLDHVVVGQPATVRFDAYPELELAAKVASIGAGTGSEFSVLPAQNANGNWVKVTQRVPIRLAITGRSPRRLIAGLSAKVEIDVSGTPSPR